MTTVKKFLITGYFGYGLVGDEAVLSVSIRDIRAKYADATIYVTSNDVEETSTRYDVHSVPIDDLKVIVALLPSIDLVVVAAAGGYNEHAQIEPFHSIDEPVPYNRLCIEIPVLAFTHGVKCVIFAAGIDDLHSDDARHGVRICFDIATERALRDSSALQSLVSTGASREGVVVSCDPAWTWRAGGDEDRGRRLKALGLDTARPVVGLTLRHWDEEPLRLSTEPQSWESEMAAALQRFADDTGAQYILVPLQSRTGYIFADDVEFLDKFRKRLPNVTTVTWYDDLAPESIVSVLAICDLSVAMRHHGAILAAATCVPTVAVAYSKKVRGAFEDAGLGDCVIDLKGFEADNIVCLLTRLLNDKAAQKLRLERIVEERNASHQETLRLFDSAMAQNAPKHRQSAALAEKYNLFVVSPDRSRLKPAARAAVGDMLQTAILTGQMSEATQAVVDDFVKAYPQDCMLQFYSGLADILSLRDPVRGNASLEQAAAQGYAVEWCLYWQSRSMLLIGDYNEAICRLEAALACNSEFDIARSALEELIAPGRPVRAPTGEG